MEEKPAAAGTVAGSAERALRGPDTAGATVPRRGRGCRCGKVHGACVVGLRGWGRVAGRGV